jgi:hypothetical protein
VPASRGGQREPPYHYFLVFGQRESVVIFCKLSLGHDTNYPVLIQPAPPSVGPGNGIARLLPGVYPAQEGLGVGKPLAHKLFCRPGRGVLCASGAVKDDFLVLGQARQSV